MKRGPFLATALLLMVVTGVACQPRFQPGPFLVRPESLRSTIDTIAFRPLSASPRLVSPERARDRFESLALERLNASGRRILPPGTWATTWLDIAAEIGEIFDRTSGEVDAARFEIVDEAVRASLRRNEGVDAVLHLEILDVRIERPSDPVEFCASRRRPYFEGPGGPVGLVRHRIQSARGTCLVARLYDIDGRELYRKAHGIEIIETLARRTRSIRPIDERLASRRGIEIAVEQVLSPLVERLGVPED